MTRTQAREWMIRHWSADDDGTDLDFDTLVDAYLATFGRMPAEDEDAFGALKAHILSTLTPTETTEIETAH